MHAKTMYNCWKQKSKESLQYKNRTLSLYPFAQDCLTRTRCVH